MWKHALCFSFNSSGDEAFSSYLLYLIVACNTNFVFIYKGISTKQIYYEIRKSFKQLIHILYLSWNHHSEIRKLCGNLNLSW